MAPSEIIERRASLQEIRLRMSCRERLLGERQTYVEPGGSIEIFQVGGIKGKVSCSEDDEVTKIDLEKQIAVKNIDGKEPQEVMLGIKEELRDGQEIAISISNEESVIIRHNLRKGK